jgi:transcriptional regulator with XRE-family HTH domain
MARRRAKRPTPTLWELRHQRGWTTHELAHRTGLSERTIRYVERGEVVPTLPTLRALATAFNLDVTDLVPQATKGPLPDAVSAPANGS